jgi:ubiquitin C-terminal hydrolase
MERYSPNKFCTDGSRRIKEKNRDMFTGWVQNDITEFLIFLMDCMHNSLS